MATTASVEVGTDGQVEHGTESRGAGPVPTTIEQSERADEQLTTVERELRNQGTPGSDSQEERREELIGRVGKILSCDVFSDKFIGRMTDRLLQEREGRKAKQQAESESGTTDLRAMGEADGLVRRLFVSSNELGNLRRLLDGIRALCEDVCEGRCSVLDTERCHTVDSIIQAADSMLEEYEERDREALPELTKRLIVWKAELLAGVSEAA